MKCSTACGQVYGICIEIISAEVWWQKMSNSAHMWASLDNKITLCKDCKPHAGVHSTYYL
jgi:hypothetical protein